MDWWLSLSIILGGFLVLMILGMPVAFSFMAVNIVGIYLLWGGGAGLGQLILNIRASLASFILMPIPLFILMGEVMFHSGIAPKMMDTLDKWFGRLPGRLGLIAVAGGTLFATLTGHSASSVAMMGAVLTPEMERRGYKKPMSLGPILGSGGLAIMIPPSGLAVLLGVLGKISVGKILIAIIIPGLLMGFLYTAYIIGRCWVQPEIAPSYEVSLPPLSVRVKAAAKYVLPLGFIIFMVVGIIFLGLATPTEAAATGAISTFILAAAYGRLTWDMAKEAIIGSLEITSMILMIIVGANIFSQILTFSGASRGLINLATSLDLPPLGIFLAVQFIILYMGTFMSSGAIMMVTLPMFVPIMQALGIDLIWFAVVMLINVEIATTSPPFGVSLFVMKGVAPPNTTMGDIYKAALPFIYCDIVAITLVIMFPAIALWLPNIMH